MLRTVAMAAIAALGLSGTAALMAQDEDVVVVQQTQIKRVAGEVIGVRANMLTMRHEDGSGRQTYRIPRGASISVAGEQIRLQDLQQGQKIRVYYRETSTGRVIVMSPPEETETVVVVEPEPAPAPPPPPAPEPAPVMLPSTASFVPLLGAAGLGFLGLGGLLAGLRRRSG